MVEKFNKALEDARKAFTLDTQFIKAYLRASKCYIATGQTNNAMITLQTAQNLEPSNKTITEEVRSFLLLLEIYNASLFICNLIFMYHYYYNCLIFSNFLERFHRFFLFYF